MEDLKYWVWLSRIEDINKKTLLKLLEKYKTPKNLWNADDVGAACYAVRVAYHATPTKYR